MWQSHGQKTIYMALAAVKSDRRSLAICCLTRLASLCLSWSWKFRFDMRNLFENFIAFHARTIWPPAACVFQAAAATAVRQVSNVTGRPLSAPAELLCVVVSFYFLLLFSAFFAMFWHF